MGKPLRPKAIHFVPDLPKTRNAKILRRVVKAVYLGLPPGDLTALENPQSLDAIGAARA
jgi:acetyl-CoA synthetase